MSRPVITFDPVPHTYTVNGKPDFPSVTTIIAATVAKDFSIGANWGYKIAMHTAATMPPADAFESVDTYCKAAREINNPNLVRDAAGARGTRIHDALEQYAKTGLIPVPSDYPDEDHKRIVGIAAWLDENRPVFIGSEVRTASLKWKYVGSLDAYLAFGAGEFEGKTARIDYKTGSRIYPSENFPQLAAYEAAEIECGEPPSDLQIVVHIPESGRCKMRVGTDKFSDFKVLLMSYRSMERRKKRIKRDKK